MKTIELMKSLKTRIELIPVVLIALAVTFTACESDDDVMMPEPEKTIVDVAAEAGQFTVLIQAAQKAGLADFLSTESNITVFAPTDNAFSLLLSDLGLSSLDDLDATTVADILKYHVVSGMAYSNSLASGVIPSLNTSSPDQKPLSLLVNVNSDVMINNATVKSPDIMASNGIIHIIDRVLLPPSVVDIAIYTENFSSLVSAVVKADFVNALNSAGPFTVFAPTNDAFSALFNQLNISGLSDLSVEDLTSILTYHVVGDNVLSSELKQGPVNTISGKSFEVTLGTNVFLNGTIKVVGTDIQGRNGVIHVIDQVLIPE